MLTLGSGTIGAKRGEVTFGHFAGRWHTEQHEHDGAAAGEGQPAAGPAELFIGGEGLRRGAGPGARDAAA